MVEQVMRAFAADAGEDVEYWGAVGLLHDLDYEEYPQEHCVRVVEMLKDANVDDAFIHAVVSHGWGSCTDVEPEKYMEKVLYAIDELTGLIHAAALMRPSKSCDDMELKSLKKKYKSPAFAAGVDRGVIERGAQMLDMSLDVLLERTLEAMKSK